MFYAAIGRHSHLTNAKFGQYLIAGGSKSRNKVAVGEPAAGSVRLTALREGKVNEIFAVTPSTP